MFPYELWLWVSKIEARKRFAPSATVRIVGDVRRDVPAGSCSVERRVERVERFVGVESVRIQVEDVAEERRPASLVRHDDNVLGRRFLHCWSLRITFSNLRPTSIST